MKAIRAAAAVALCVLVPLGGCTEDRAATPGTPPGVAAAAQLVFYDSCDDLLSWFRAQGTAHVGPYGLDDFPLAEVARSDAMQKGEVPATTADAGSGEVAGDGELPTGTNNQEAGVDEADIVKLIGTRLFTVHADRLIIAELESGVPVEVASLVLPVSYPTNMFVTGNRVYVAGVAPFAGDDPLAGPADGMSKVPADVARSYYGTPNSAIVEVSLTGTPEIVGQVMVEGEITSGRLTDGTVRFVMVRAAPALGFVMPVGDDDAAIARAIRANREVVATSTIDQWLPYFTGASGVRTPLVECGSVSRPSVDAGLGSTTVLTISDGLPSMNATMVVADGGITYASPDGLYLATPRWSGEPVPATTAQEEASVVDDSATVSDDGTAVADIGVTTQIHRFDTSTKNKTTYQASGEVQGSLIGQYAMSEWQGNLRVASTASVGRTGTNEAQRSLVTVLGRQGDRLMQVGRLDGLGPTEQIYGVRFDGPTGYVVTFRQTDPLYVVDLSDPVKPVLLGELKVPGFSSYLHPVGDHRMLGVGSAATEQGSITGAKVSLYDTSDPAAPRELWSQTMPATSFLASYDPHAFTWDSEHRLVVLGADRYGDTADDSGGGAVVLRVDDRVATVVGWIDHDDHVPPQFDEPYCPADAACIAYPDIYVGGPILRSVFVRTAVGVRLAAISDAGISTNDIESLGETGWLGF